MNKIKFIELPKSTQRIFEEYKAFEKKIKLEIEKLFVPERYLTKRNQ